MNRIVYLLSLSSLLSVGAQASITSDFGDLENSPKINIPSELQGFQNIEMPKYEFFSNTKPPISFFPIAKKLLKVSETEVTENQIMLLIVATLFCLQCKTN